MHCKEDILFRPVENKQHFSHEDWSVQYDSKNCYKNMWSCHLIASFCRSCSVIIEQVYMKSPDTTCTNSKNLTFCPKAFNSGFADAGKIGWAKIRRNINTHDVTIAISLEIRFRSKMFCNRKTFVYSGKICSFKCLVTRKNFNFIVLPVTDIGKHKFFHTVFLVNTKHNICNICFRILDTFPE